MGRKRKNSTTAEPAGTPSKKAKSSVTGDKEQDTENSTTAEPAGTPSKKAKSSVTGDKGQDSENSTTAEPAGTPKNAKSTVTGDKEQDTEKPTTSSSSDPYNLSDEMKPWKLKVSSWNVNGIKAWLQKKDALEYVKKEDPDIFCIQETKCNESDLPKEATLRGYHRYWAKSETKGYSGVGLYSKTKPEKVTYGIGVSEHDKEGRVITAEYENFFLVTSYTPNAGQGLKRLDYRQTWDKDFREYIGKLDNTKPVILCGDLNVAHKEIDLANPKTNTKTAGFTKEEREGFSKLLEQGYIDTYRHFYPDRKNQYSFWSYKRNARDKNVGWRLDYFVVSERLMPKISHSLIRDKILGSDHAPVLLLLSP